jgi:hypothetical protein
VLIFGIAAVLLRLPGEDKRAPFALLAGGVMAFLVADLAYGGRTRPSTGPRARAATVCAASAPKPTSVIPSVADVLEERGLR